MKIRVSLQNKEYYLHISAKIVTVQLRQVSFSYSLSSFNFLTTYSKPHVIS